MHRLAFLGASVSGWLGRTAAVALLIAASGGDARDAGTIGHADPVAAIGNATEAIARGDYLSAMNGLQLVAFDRGGDVANPAAAQVWNQIQAMVSGQPAPSAAFKRRQASPVYFEVDRVRTVDAFQTIVTRARKTRIVIINENHATPCQRSLVSRLARSLRPLGYDTLALEALENSSATKLEALQNRGYPVHSDGFYLNDPSFGSLVRRSLRLGYRLHAYEAPAGDSKSALSDDERERSQAQLLGRYLLGHPGSKILVLSGGSHLAESSRPGERVMMAEWLKRLYGFDPLTIDQNTLQPGNPIYTSLLNYKTRGERLVYRNNKPLVLGRLEGRVDLQILPAINEYESGRPACLADGWRKLVRFTLNHSSGQSPIFVQVFGRDDGPDAVPIDQLLIEKPVGPVSLFIPKAHVQVISKAAPMSADQE